MDEEDVLQEIRDLVLVQEKRVTSNFVEKKYDVSDIRAREIIQSFRKQLEEEGRGNEVICSFIICGYNEDHGNGEGDTSRDDCSISILKFWHVDEEDLEISKKTYTTVTGVALKSIRHKECPRFDSSLESTLPGRQRKRTTATNVKQEIIQLGDSQDKVCSRGETSLSDKPSVSISGIKQNGSSKTSDTEKNGECRQRNNKSSHSNVPTKKSSSTNIKKETKKEANVKHEEPVDILGSSTDEEEEPVVKRGKSRIASDSEDEEEIVPVRKKRRRVQVYSSSSDEDETENRRLNDEEESNQSDEVPKKLSRKEKAMLAKEEKEQEKERKMNGRVKVKESDPGESVELEEIDEVCVDEDGYEVTRRIKRAAKKIQANEIKEEKLDKVRPEKTSNNSRVSSNIKEKSSGESASSQPKKKNNQPTSQKKITDFFGKPKK